MKVLKQTGKLAPREKPWQLIRDAVADLKMQSKMKNVEIDINGPWHMRYGICNKGQQVCYQCFAGVAMVRRCKADWDSPGLVPDAFPKSVRYRLLALYNFAIGLVGYAYQHLELPLPRGIAKTREISDYCADMPLQFYVDMLQLADDLEEAHYQKFKRETRRTKKCQASSRARTVVRR